MAMTENMTTAGKLGSSREGVALSVVKQTAFASASDTFQTAHAVAARLENLVNRIAGHEPPQPSAMNGVPRNDPDGVLDELREGANDAARALNRAEACLDRLERELP